MESLNTEERLANKFTVQHNVLSEKMKDLVEMYSASASLIQKVAQQSDEMESWKRSVEERMNNIESSVNQLLQRQDPPETSST